MGNSNGTLRKDEIQNAFLDACMTDDLEKAKLFIADGAEPALDGWFSLTWARLHNSVSVAKFILEIGGHRKPLSYDVSLCVNQHPEQDEMLALLLSFMNDEDDLFDYGIFHAAMQRECTTFLSYWNDKPQIGRHLSTTEKSDLLALAFECANETALSALTPYAEDESLANHFVRSNLLGREAGFEIAIKTIPEHRLEKISEFLHATGAHHHADKIDAHRLVFHTKQDQIGGAKTRKRETP